MTMLQIFEPAMCCSTGLCGVGVDPELMRISTALEALKKAGIQVDRFNLNSTPMEFVTNTAIAGFLQENGAQALPVTVKNGEIVISGRYPTNEELAALTGAPADVFAGKTAVKVKPMKKSAKSGCGCEGGCC